MDTDETNPPTPPGSPEAKPEAKPEAPLEPKAEAIAVVKPKATKRRASASSAPQPSPGVDATLATGRRKEAVARVRLMPVSGTGSGSITVNHKSSDTYFGREALRWAISQPLVVTHQLGKYDVVVRVDGGGMTGQAGAIRLGIARALIQVDPAHRGALRGAGFLTRDPRMRERKKYGQKGARKQFQWTKR